MTTVEAVSGPVSLASTAIRVFCPGWIVTASGWVTGGEATSGPAVRLVVISDGVYCFKGP